MRLPKNVKTNKEEAERNGHTVVSSGCGLFRCTACGKSAWLDNERAEGHLARPCAEGKPTK